MEPPVLIRNRNQNEKSSPGRRGLLFCRMGRPGESGELKSKLSATVLVMENRLVKAFPILQRTEQYQKSVINGHINIDIHEFFT